MKEILIPIVGLLIFSLALSACGPVDIGIRLPGGPSEGGNQESTNTLLYAVILLAGAAIVIALVSAVRRP